MRLTHQYGQVPLSSKVYPQEPYTRYRVSKIQYATATYCNNTTHRS